MSFNWKKFDAWRQHPLITNNNKHMFPGLKLGFAAFAAYVVYDQTMNSGKADAHH